MNYVFNVKMSISTDDFNENEWNEIFVDIDDAKAFAEDVYKKFVDNYGKPEKEGGGKSTNDEVSKAIIRAPHHVVTDYYNMKYEDKTVIIKIVAESLHNIYYWEGKPKDDLADKAFNYVNIM